MASRRRTGSKGKTKVRTASLSMGGVAIKLISRTPESASCSVRGMGVAVRVRIWTSARSCFKRSFWATPKCCSSSTISNPRWWKEIFFPNRVWVPITISMDPSERPLRMPSVLACGVRRDSCSMHNGRPLNRDLKRLKCCRHKRVVGTMTATWTPFMAATKAARRATSVLPNPTSPQIRRSMGLPPAISSRVSSMAASWSSVSG